MRSGVICHVDMDAFFAAVEVRANPRLKGLPLLIGGGPGGRGVVTTASYPARSFGIRSGMSIREALARCPEAVCLPVDPARYISASETLLGIFETITPLLEPASIDEVFLDLSDLRLDPAGCLELAREIKKKVLNQERLTCSIGLGRNKLQAKMATGLRKPDGLTQLLPGDFEKIFWPRPTGDLWGIGPRTSRQLASLGIRTIGDLARADGRSLERIFGIGGRVAVLMARGEGGGAVVPWYRQDPARSMGHEMTLARDTCDLKPLERHLLLLCDRLARRLRREEFAGHVVILKLRLSDRSLISRQTALARPTDEERVLLVHSRRLLRNNLAGRPVRLIGVGAGHLVRRNDVYPLFEEDRRHRRLVETRDRIRDRFGERVLLPAGVMELLR